MPKNKCGLTKEQREKYLRDHGFVRLRQGKGSHEEWEHPELKLLSRTHKIITPANLLSNIGQHPWETTLSGDPASGTWKAIAKHAEWCRKTAEEIKAKSDHDGQRCKLVSQHRKAVHDFKERKKTVKHKLKADQPIDSPGDSETWQEVQRLLKAKNDCSTHHR
jgi:predicted RNA binding protein YcfA (HicA-like mRNA interferase family)